MFKSCVLTLGGKTVAKTVFSYHSVFFAGAKQSSIFRHILCNTEKFSYQLPISFSRKRFSEKSAMWYFAFFLFSGK
jgi:hypothetical protein